jgi:iron complex outermembrane receptor protein
MKLTKPCPFKLSLLSISLVCAGMIAPVMAASETTDVGTVRITGEGDNLANGYMIEEDGAKAKSTVTKAVIDKTRPTANPYQLLNLEAGVNAYSHDATGMFGGNLRVRGFNSDQMGFTINGAPVNDSGNFAVYPQEYTDSENLCEISITQGSADTDAPHVGASGGNVSLVSCSPKDASGGKFSQTLGQLNFSKTFLRLDTGLLGKDSPVKVFISASSAKVNKFKGPGIADRKHVDFGLEWKITSDTSFTSSFLYNRAVNNNYMTLTKSQWQQNPNADYSSNVPQHLASGNENVATSFGYDNVKGPAAYYGYSLNPFENYLLTSRLSSRINKQLTLSAEPYYWYGNGTGGTQQTTLAESSSGSSLGNGVNINRNVSNDTVGIYSGSVTETHRPGITFKANYEIDNNKILAGYWIESARHNQTRPATIVDNNGNIGDLWLRTNLITLNDGSIYQNRNYQTISTGQSVFLLDTISLSNDRLQLLPGIRYTSIKRDFTNYASYGAGYGAYYEASRTYSKALPSIGVTYKFSDPWQVYGNITQNMRAPSNFVLSGWATSTNTNGVPTLTKLTPNDAIKEETSTNYEGGARYNGEQLTGSFALYYVDLSNRIASALNPTTNLYTDYNVGNSRINGFEVHVGSKPVNGWSVYGSATYTDSKILSDFPSQKGSTAVMLPTSGKIFPDSPKWMYAGSLQYSTGPYLAALSGKYVGARYSTLMNDESIDGYTIFDFDAGYKFQSFSFMKTPTVRLNISNLFNANYLNANSGSGSNITATTDTSYKGSGTPSYYVGAPRFASMTFVSEF